MTGMQPQVSLTSQTMFSVINSYGQPNSQPLTLSVRPQILKSPSSTPPLKSHTQKRSLFHYDIRILHFTCLITPFTPLILCWFGAFTKISTVTILQSVVFSFLFGILFYLSHLHYSGESLWITHLNLSIRYIQKFSFKYYPDL